MSREIKFRVWDGTAMYDATEYPDWTLGDFANAFRMAPEYRPDPERYKLMQYTGLKDKNGKELYHDDVVMLLHGGYAEWQPCHVVADDFGTPGFIPIGEPIFLTFERYFMESKAPRAAFEIISNIHEHPELLNQTGH
ncbi:MAG: hypothetical protein E6Q97_04540 [Desulfurellales bacterium]|nr:MAG: hypothetical protein E6Q97_04540 [Desulfurellales bacterium]